MSVSLPNGSLVAIEATEGAALTVTVATNANPCVMTSTSHGLSNGDVVKVTSGWSRLDGKMMRVANVTTNTFELEGYNTSSTTIYPAGTGIGSVREVTAFTQLSQILSSASSGGDQNFLTYQFLEADGQVRIPTFKNPAGIDFEVADDPSLAGYILASTANDDRVARGIRVTLANGAIIYYVAYVSLNKTPSLTVNNVMAVKVTLSLLNEPVRYTS